MKYSMIAFLLLYLCKTGIAQISEASNAQTAGESGLSQKQSELIYQKVKVLPEGAQISLAIIEHGAAKFYGVARKGDAIVSESNFKKVFEIGSITKVFTATLLANLVLENRIRLQENINDHLDYPIRNDVPITFQQLATHSSGLPRVPTILSAPTLSLANPYKDFGEAELKHYLVEELELSYPQGEKSEYSNLGVGLLGYVLSEVANTSYEELLQKKIFQRYEMKSTTTVRTQVESLLVHGLNEDGQKVSNWDMAVLMGAGGILSTAEDLAKFALAHFNDSNEEFALTRTPFYRVANNYSTGLAWGIITNDSGADWLWHNGGTGGYTSSMILNTETKNGIIILSNLSALGELSANITSLSPALMSTLE